MPEFFILERTRGREAGGGEAKGKVPTGDGRFRASRRPLGLPPEATAEGTEVLRLGRLPNGETKDWRRLGQADIRQQGADRRGDPDTRVRSNP